MHEESNSNACLGQRHTKKQKTQDPYLVATEERVGKVSTEQRDDIANGLEGSLWKGDGIRMSVSWRVQ